MLVFCICYHVIDCFISFSTLPKLAILLRIIDLLVSIITIIIIICSLLRVFHTNISWWLLTGVWVITSLFCRKCPRCNGYRRRKRTRRHEFKSWTRLIAFHIALIPLGKVWIQLFIQLLLWVNNKADWVFSLDEATSLGEGKLWIQTC